MSYLRGTLGLVDWFVAALELLYILSSVRSSVPPTLSSPYETER